jgi:hypothetical protein
VHYWIIPSAKWFAGSNYAKHIQEMGSATPEEPVLFIKPETALCDIRQPLVLPQGWVRCITKWNCRADRRNAASGLKSTCKSDCRLRRGAGSDPARRAG